MDSFVYIDIDNIYVNENKMCNLDSSGLDYYLYFKEMMSNIYNHTDTYNYKKSNYFYYCINSTDARDIFIHRAIIIKLKEIYNCTHDIAMNLCEIKKKLKLSLPVADIATSVSIIIENYISIMDKIKKGEHIDPIIGLIDENGKIRIIDGFHRAILQKICGIKTIKVIIANRH